MQNREQNASVNKAGSRLSAHLSKMSSVEITQTAFWSEISVSNPVHFQNHTKSMYYFGRVTETKQQTNKNTQ